VRPLGDPGRPFDDALEYVVGWYAEQGQPAMIRVVSGSNIGAELDRRGWGTDRAAVFQTFTVARLLRSLEARGHGVGGAVRTTTAPPTSWLARYEGGAHTPIALQLLTGGADVVFATIEVADSTAAAVAIGRAAVEPPWAGFAAIEVDPEMRRQGHARAVMVTLTEWAASRGAVRAWLEVLADNHPALALYASLGFTDHHRYSYRTPPA
jgi:GNAT superfamily N-acetyltransferase